MSTEHTTFREALMRSYVRGWEDGREGARTDDGKIVTADDLVREFPCEAASSDLLTALDATMYDLAESHAEDKAADHYGDDSCSYCDDITAAEAAIAKARPEANNATS